MRLSFRFTAARRRAPGPIAVGGLVVMSLLLPSNAARGATIQVCASGCRYTAIAPALEAAADGDVIEVGAGTYAGGIVVSKAVTIRGAGRTETIISSAKSATVALQNLLGRSTLESVTVSGGIGLNIDQRRYGGGIYVKGKSATIKDVLVTGNGTERGVGVTYNGGGIYLDAGDVTMTDVHVVGNRATNSGGGVVVNIDATLTMNGGRIADNEVKNADESNPETDTNARGGGIYVEDRTTLTGVEISGNHAAASGGGANVAGVGRLTLTDCVVRNNRSHQGGGIYNTATVTIVGGRIEGNTASGETEGSSAGGGDGLASGGGGLLSFGTASLEAVTVANNASMSNGGGLVSIKGLGGTQFGRLTASRCTITGNTAKASGGGLYAANDDPNDTLGAEVTVDRSTLYGNTALDGGAALLDFGRLEFRDSTVVNNNALGDGDGLMTNQDNALRVGSTILSNEANGANCFNKIASLGNNIDSDGTCAFANRDDTVSTQLELGPLADNGGPTHTLSIGPNSAAIDMGNPGRCAQNPLDQRGAVRPVDGDGDGVKRCDVGSFEFGAEIAGTATPTSTRTPTGQSTNATPRTATPTPSRTPTFVIGSPSPSPTFVEGEPTTPPPPTTPVAGRSFMPFANKP